MIRKAGVAVPLTPAEIDSVAFRRPHTGTTGYHEDDVDRFLDDVAGEMRRLESENRTLTDQLTHTDLADHADLAERVRRAELDCLVAQERARALEAELEQARAAASAARRPADPRMLEMAQRTADDHLGDAHREAETLVEQAITKAGQLVSEAQLRASTIVADARHAHAEAIAGLTAKRAAAIDEINELSDVVRQIRAAVADDATRRLTDLGA
ncbi:DivIVA domain-containing protein [Actinoplanes awajinensis]|uniref:DivIVA domain-containing protein n=1 Tax=Actinoplanes awajinensis TaxID=135946 RepID=UPI001E585521|nr:DivIVA domain-containing protein [Actinoplanes awajinensis]